MAPKRRHTKESILNGSFNFVREKGFEKISARRVATFINASTAPIYSNFKSMEELEDLLEVKAIDTLKEFLMEEMKDDGSFLNVPLKYIEFAMDDSNLFNQISKSNKSIKTLRNHLEEEVYVEMKKSMKRSNFMKKFSDKELESIIVKTWFQSHGIATFLDKSKSKEENLKNAEFMLKDNIYATAYAMKNNYPKKGL